MHRISYFDQVSYANSKTYSIMYGVRTFPESEIVTSTTLNLMCVQGAPGPRFETMKKGPTISGYPGGPVHGVDHFYLGGAVLPESGGGYEGLSSFNTTLVVPICDCIFNPPASSGGYPILYRGQCKAKLLSVALLPKDELGPGNKPYNIIVEVQLVGRSRDPFVDDVFSWRSMIYLWCPHDKKGNYAIIDADAPPYGGIGSWSWIDAPHPMIPQVDIIRMTGTVVSTNRSSPFRTVPPYFDSLKDYWEREKSSLKELPIDPDIVRDCTLEAISDCAFTEALNYENLSDLLEAAATIRGAVNLWKDFRTAIRKIDPVKLLKVVASAHLIWRYVVKTTAKDLRDLHELAMAIWEHREDWWGYLTIARGRSKELEFQITAKRSKRVYDTVVNLRFDMRPAQGHLVEYLRRTGMSPALVGFWDIVPLSFVVDWVLPIGETIEAVEVLIDLQYLDFLSVTTQRCHRPVNESIYPGLRLWGESGRFQRIVSRTYQGTWAPPSFRIKNPFKNLWTGIALAIAMIKSR